jgi:hypothetical protein
MIKNDPGRQNPKNDVSKDLKKLIIKARRVLSRNYLEDHTVPSVGLYPHQVLWDSCFVAIGKSHYDPELAKNEIIRLLDAQWSNGMIPHIIFNSASRFWWDRQIWRRWINFSSPNHLATSGISQPPMLAEAIVRIGRVLPLSERQAWYKSVFPGLLAYHEWLYRERDPRGEGLVLQLHPWETGLDTSPPCIAELHDKSWPGWLNILDIPLIDKIGEHIRFDNKFVSKGERASNAEAIALHILRNRIRHRDYDSSKVLENAKFAMQDITYNSILIRANTLLEEIAVTINESIPIVLQRHTSKAAVALESLWDNDTHSYYSRDFISNKLIKEPSIGGLLPLYSGLISKDRATRLVNELKDIGSFGLNYPIPSVPVNSKWFSPNRYWQGPTWVNTNWLVIDGLRRYGFNEHAKKLTLSTLKLVSQHGFYEYFDPISGVSHGADNFSWTAALTVDLAYGAKGSDY